MSSWWASLVQTTDHHPIINGIQLEEKWVQLVAGISIGVLKLKSRRAAVSVGF